MFPRIGKVIRTVFQPKYLFCTNITLSTSLSGIGDILEQKYEILINEQKEWNKTRSIHMAISGTTVGIFGHHWYILLERKIPGRCFRSVLKKTFIDLSIGSPIGISTLIITLSVLKNYPFDGIIDEFKRKAWRLYVAECFVWMPAQLVNFSFIPLQYRLLYDNLLSLAYDVFTSYVMHDLQEDRLKRT